MTFSLDEATAARLRRTSETLQRSKSEIVREAIQDYADRVGKLGEAERRRMLEIFDTQIAALPSQPLDEVEKELDEIRRSRNHGGRRSGIGQ